MGLPTRLLPSRPGGDPVTSARKLEAEAESEITEAQLAIVDGDYVAAQRRLLAAWGLVMRLAYPPKPDTTVVRLLKGEGA